MKDEKNIKDELGTGGLMSVWHGWVNKARALKQRLALRTRFTRWLRRFMRMKVVKFRGGIELIRNWVIDRRYGGWCGGVYQSRFGSTGAWGTSSVDYYQMPRIFHRDN